MVLYENQRTIGDLIASLALMGDDVGLAVHDNGPGATTLAAAQDAATRAGLPFRGEVCADNCGFGSGCNSLALASAAEQVLFLNPDAALLSWPSQLFAAGGIVGAFISDPAGHPASSSARRRSLWDEICLRWLRRRQPAAAGQGYVSGAAMLIPTQVFRQLGGFDSRYFMYYEDIDLCSRAGDAGVSVLLDPQWRVVHLGGHSVGRSVTGLRTALLRSYDSGRSYHRSRGHSTRAYDALCLVDALFRVLTGLVPSRRPSARANAAVALRAGQRLLTG